MITPTSTGRHSFEESDNEQEVFGDGEGPRNEELDEFQLLRRTEFQNWRRQQVEIAGNIRRA